MPNPPTTRDLQIKDQLIESVTVLTDAGRADLAEAVQVVLSPKGWPLLGRLRAGEGGSPRPVNKPVRTTRSIRDHIKAAADAAGDTVTDKANEGLRLYLAGEFLPERPQRASHGSNTGDQVTLNLSADDELWKQVDNRKTEARKELGWTPYPSTVALAYLLTVYPMPADTTAE